MLETEQWIVLTIAIIQGYPHICVRVLALSKEGYIHGNVLNINKNHNIQKEYIHGQVQY